MNQSPNPTAPPFTSNLLVGDWLLVKQSGYVPLGLVMGASVFQSGAQWTSGGWSNSDRMAAAKKGISYELSAQTTAYYTARNLAMDRMRDHAQQLGAHLVAEVKVERVTWSVKGEVPVYEFKASGTAFRGPGKAPATPVLCNLSGAEVWQLQQNGYAPRAIVVGNCYWQHYSSVASTRLLATGIWTVKASAELSDVTQALYEARALAMGRMQTEARKAAAQGVIGVQVTSEIYHTAPPAGASANNATNTSFTCHFMAVGTAVAANGHESAPAIQTVSNLSTP